MQSYEREILFGRMLGIVKPSELDLLGKKAIAVPGCGGVGFTHAEMLVRSGVGRIHIADLDIFGPENMNRQFGATTHTIGKAKVDVLAERLTSINPELTIVKFDRVQEDMLDRFLSGIDLVCDAMDYFIMSPRLALHRAARKKGIPVMNAGPIGFGAILHLTDPVGMTFEEYFGIEDHMTNNEMLARFGVGIDPAHLYRHYQDSPYLDFRNRAVSSLSSSCLLASSIIGSAALPILLGRQSFFKPLPYSYQLDLQAGKFIESHLPGGAVTFQSE